jgi:hypothetical protein
MIGAGEDNFRVKQYLCATADCFPFKFRQIYIERTPAAAAKINRVAPHVLKAFQ